MATYRRSAEQLGDAAAVVEAVRHCREQHEVIPQWVVTQLTVWLGACVEPYAPASWRESVPHPDVARYQTWARRYLGAWWDHLIATQVESLRDSEGLQVREAHDAAACEFRETPFARTLDGVAKAVKRARKAASLGWFRRATTGFEHFQLYLPGTKGPATPLTTAASCWWAINESRRGPRQGQWRERPELLSHLSTRELQRRARALKVGPGSGKKRPHT